MYHVYHILDIVSTYYLNYLLRRMTPLAVASMLKTLLLINDLTCLLGNAMLWWFSVGCLMVVRALCARVIPLVVTGCVSAFPMRLCACMFCALFNGNG